MSSRPERAPLDHYLDRICRRLWFVSARERRETREELRQHLESLAAHAARHVEPRQAMEDAMEKFGDPKQIATDLSRQGLRRRRWLSALIKSVKVSALVVTALCLGLTGYWYFALSRPMEREPVPPPTASAAMMLAAIQAAQDGYARQIRSVRFQGSQTVHAYYQGHGDRTETHAYQVAAKGALYYSREVEDSHFGSKPDETSHGDDVYVSDGKTLREVLTEWNGPAGSLRAKETHGVRAYLRDNKYKPFDPDEALQYGYKVHDAWIGDVLRRGSPVVEGAVMHPQFGLLTVVRCRNKTPWGEPETVRLWLAPKLGWMAVKTETERGLSPRFPEREVEETEQVAKAGAFWVTTQGKLHLDYLALGHRQPIIDRPRHFANIAFNTVPASLFMVHYPVGTALWTGSGDATKLTVLRPSGQWEAQPLMNSPGIDSQWPLALAGVITLGGIIGFAVLRVRRRGRRLAA